MEVVVGIITAQRSKSLIDKSLETYFGQGLPAPHVFCEPGADNFYYKSQVVLHRNKRNLGCFNNWWFASLYLLHHYKADYILLCEDDVGYSKYAWKIMSDYKSPDKVLSGWTPIVNATKGVVGWYPAANMNRYGLCGSLCWLFPRKILAEVIFNRHITKVNRIHLDTDVGFALNDLKVGIYVHHPSLVTHLGVGSSTFDLKGVPEHEIVARNCYAECDTRRT